jgi:uroporphyrinogen decarboxylase
MASALSPRERVRLALEHRETDRIPIALVCSGINAPVRRDLDAYLQETRGIDTDAYLRPLIDIRYVSPAYTGPRLEAGEDFWGVKRSSVSYGEGTYDEISYYPLAQAETVDDLETHRWPSTDLFDYSVIPDRIREIRSDREYALMAANGNIFESSWYMRGFDRIFMDFVLNPDLARHLLERVTSFWTAHITNMLEAADGEIDCVFTADDIAGQSGLLMSLDMWGDFLQPLHARMNRALHEFDVKIFYHSDGSVTEAVPGLIDMGIDVLQALQFSAENMDPVFLKDAYGDRLCFEGGVSVQTTLPHGTPDDVRAEVRHLIDILGKNGGYVLGASHAVQAGTPPENITAMFDTAAAYHPSGLQTG